MCKKCILVLLAGASGWEGLRRILVAAKIKPSEIFGYTVTPTVNYLFIAAALVISGLFLYLATKERCICDVKG